jgi:hypothetical protein
MKNLSLIFLSLFLFVEIGNSQVIKIEVTEVFDSFGYDTSVFNFINNDSLVYDETRKVNGLYDLDLKNKSFTHFKNNIVECEGEITFENKDGIIAVKLLIEGYDIWMVINTEIDNEQVIWYSTSENFIELCKFSKFQILKSS